MLNLLKPVVVALCLSSVAAAQTAGTHLPSVVTSLPRGAAPDAVLPTVIGLHGRGGNATSYAGFLRRLLPEARIISLQAPTSQGDGYTWLQARLANADGARVTRELQRAVKGLRPRIRQALRAAPSCGEPIIVGFSQGGALALALAAERFEGVSAFIDLAGALPAGYPVAAKGAVPRVISLHGRDDAVVPVASTRRALQSIRKAGVPVKAIEFAGGHDATEDMRETAKWAIELALRQACPEEP